MKMEELNQEWDKVFSKSEKVDSKKVTFKEAKLFCFFLYIRKPRAMRVVQKKR